MGDLGLVSDTFSQVHSCLVKAGQVHSEYDSRLSSKVGMKSTITAYMYITQQVKPQLCKSILQTVNFNK